MHDDLNTKIDNFKFTCAGKARKCIQDAEILEDDRVAFGLPELIKRRHAEAAKCRADANVWKDREAKAREGYVLVDTSDYQFMLQHGPLISEAAAASRVEFSPQEKTPRYAASRLGLLPQAD
jgi:hypothetical protein